MVFPHRKLRLEMGEQVNKIPENYMCTVNARISVYHLIKVLRMVTNRRFDWDIIDVWGFVDRINKG